MTRMSAKLLIRTLWFPSPGTEPASVYSSILPRIWPSRDQPVDFLTGGINGYLRGSEPTSPLGLVPPPQLCLAESGLIKAKYSSYGADTFKFRSTPSRALAPHPFPTAPGSKLLLSPMLTLQP